MTGDKIHAIYVRMEKRETISIRLKAGTLASIDRYRHLRETKLDFIRRAIANECNRRAHRKVKPSTADPDAT